MRNLIQFIYRNYYFFLFLLLESIAVLMLVQGNNYQRTTFLNSSSAVSGNLYAALTEVTDYFNLKTTNQILAEENAQLRDQLKSSFENFSDKMNLVKDSSFKLKYTYLVARVVNNSTNRKLNYITINRGYKQGVNKGMGVITANGIVGVVRDVSENFATVMSVLHKDMNAPVAIKKFNENGILQWDGVDYRYGMIKNIPSHLKLKVNDTIVTSAYSSIFPEGIITGFVQEVIPVEGNTFNELVIRYSVDFRKLAYVYVVNNLFREEQQLLEERTINSDPKDKQ